MIKYDRDYKCFHDYGNKYIKSVTYDLEFMVENCLTRRVQFLHSSGVIRYKGECDQVNARGKYGMDKTINNTFFMSSLPRYAMILKSRALTSGRFRVAIAVPISHGFLKER